MAIKNNMRSLQSKVSILEQELIEYKAYSENIKVSLIIHKELLQGVLQNDLNHAEQALVYGSEQLTLQNVELVQRVAALIEDQEALNSRLLIMEQLNQERKREEAEAQLNFQEQLLEARQQAEANLLHAELVEKHYYSMFTFTSMALKKADKKTQKQLQDLLRAKLKQEEEFKSSNKKALKKLIVDKEQYRTELVEAQGELGRMKTLLAQAAIRQYSDNDIGFGGDDSLLEMSLAHFATENDYQLEQRGQNGGGQSQYLNEKPKSRNGGLNLNKSASNVNIKSLVPTLDLSNLKQNRDYKHWFDYAKKLEDAVKALSEKAKGLEEELYHVRKAGLPNSFVY